MTKKATSMIYSEALGDGIGVPYSDIESAMRSAAKAGLIDRIEITGADGRGVLINLFDLCVVVAELGLSPTKASEAIEYWRIYAEPASYVESKIRRQSQARQVIDDVLGDKPLLRNLIIAARDGKITREKELEHGFRLEGDFVWIAAAHPYISRLLRTARRTSLDFNAALMGIKGATRVGPKKFSGQSVRSISIPIAGFLAATEPKPTNE